MGILFSSYDGDIKSNNDTREELDNTIFTSFIGKNIEIIITPDNKYVYNNYTLVTHTGNITAYIFNNKIPSIPSIPSKPVSGVNLYPDLNSKTAATATHFITTYLNTQKKKKKY